MVDVGKKLKNLRLQSGLTQKQLAERMGVTKSVISYYELDERCPSPEILVRLASIFHVSTDYLLGRENMKVLNISELNEEEIKSIQYMIDTFKNNKKSNDE